MSSGAGIIAIWRQVPGIVGLALPIVMGLAASTLIGVTDSLMLAPLGPVPLAAVGMTNAVAVIFFAAIYGLLSALSVRIGHAHGARSFRRIPGLLRSGLLLGALVGVGGALAMGAIWPLLPLLGQPAEVLAAMPAYWVLIALFLIPFAMLTVFKSTFEAVGRPWLGTAFAFLAVIINVPLNYGLIWGLGPLPMLGLTGAGIASVMAEGLALLAAWGWWRWAPSQRRLRLRRAVDFAEMRSTAIEGAPLGAMYVVETASVGVATLMIGAFGTAALAGNQVAQSVGGLLYMLPLGVAGAVAIRVAQERGAENAAALRPIAYAALSVAMVWLVGAALVLAFQGAAIARLITDDPEVVVVATAIFLAFAPMQISDGVQSAMLGALRGLSDTAWPAAVSAIAYWLVALPLGYALAHWGGLGPAGIWAGFILALAGAGAALVWRFQRKNPLVGGEALGLDGRITANREGRMKRSRINDIMAAADDMIRHFGFVLPPFAYWTPDQFKARKAEAQRIIDARMGWDITDYGQGAFDELGLFLFTLRNGRLADLQRGGGMCYAEKLLISRKDQHSPCHTHVIKAEDIINRGGAPLAVRLNGSNPDGSFSETQGGTVICDGVPRAFTGGEVILLHPGESVTLMPGDWHAFWGEGGDVLIGEVSTVNDDVTDNVFVSKKIGRFSQIEEDVAPTHLLVADYDRWLA